MKNTSLCYILKEDRVLLLHKNRKKDYNYGMWLGVGGKFAEGESPFDCVIREAKEETGLTLNAPVYRGIITFVSDKYESEQMHLFTCRDFCGTLSDCEEGELEFVKLSDIYSLPHWKGDEMFWKPLFETDRFFSLKVVYEGETLVSHKLLYIK